MRPWYKYIVTDSLDEAINQPISTSFEDHAKDIGGFGETESYKSKESFFNAYFFGSRRVQNYDRFICKTISKDQQILGIGSGRCANELTLMERGYRVTCSDLAQPGSYRATKKLFPEFEPMTLDILAGPTGQQYDVILCLSLMYLFNDQQLHRFFNNIHASLKARGSLILDSAGPPDNLLAHWINEVYLRHEAKAVRWFKGLKHRKPHVIVTKHLGYRRTDEEIVGAAASCGFELMSQDNCDFLNVFERSRVVSRLLRILPPLKGVFQLLGRIIPYTRMYDLRKA